MGRLKVFLYFDYVKGESPVLSIEGIIDVIQADMRIFFYIVVLVVVLTWKFPA